MSAVLGREGDQDGSLPLVARRIGRCRSGSLDEKPALTTRGVERPVGKVRVERLTDQTRRLEAEDFVQIVLAREPTTHGPMLPGQPGQRIVPSRQSAGRKRASFSDELESLGGLVGKALASAIAKSAGKSGACGERSLVLNRQRSHEPERLDELGTCLGKSGPSIECIAKGEHGDGFCTRS